MMHNSLESRTSRSFSVKSSPPRPLVLGRSDSASFSNCLTPPPTNWQDSTLDNFNDKLVNRPLISALFHPPPTPITPKGLQASGEFVEANNHHMYVPAKRIATVPIASASTITESATQTTTCAKRSLSTAIDGADAIESARSTKRQEREGDLIYNPIAALQMYGVPTTYIAEHVRNIAGKFLGRVEGSCCLIKCGPLSEEGCTRVRVHPRDKALKPFFMRLVRTSRRAQLNTAEASFCNETSKPMPLHTEVAVTRAPLLATLLLSGNIYQGDTVEIELPFPEVFPEVMRWMYTGKCGQSQRLKVNKCLEVLHGR